MSAGPSLGYWPWFLLAQPAPFPERLIASDREHFLRFIFDSWTDNRDAIDATAFAEYLAALNESTFAAICADYRASFWLDRDDDAADRRSRRRIECPVLVATGEAEGQLADASDVWSAWATNLRARTLPGGHFIPEEAAEQLIEALGEFLVP
jgi:haloacetate dehalogenase